MGRKRIEPTVEEIPQRRISRKPILRTGTCKMNLLKEEIKKKATDSLKKQCADESKRLFGDIMIEQSHDSDVMEQPHDTRSGDALGSSEIVCCENLGDRVEIVRERDGVVYLKDHSGEEVRLDPAILFANVNEADRSRLLKVFVQRPDTFMRMGSLGSFFVRFALESFSRMWGMLENTKIGDLGEADLDDLLKSFGDMQRCLIKTDWLEAKLKRMGRLKKAKLEGIDRLKTIDTEREQARAEIEKLKVLLSKAEEKKQKLDEEAHALGAKSVEDISLEGSIVEGLFAGAKICSKHELVEQNRVEKRKRGEWRITEKNLSELVVMADGKPTAVLVRHTYFGWSLKHKHLAYPGVDPTHWQTYSTVKSEVS